MAVAAREGLHSVSLRAVAAEAGISLRSVQYYFDTKAGLMRASLVALEELSNERVRKHLDTLEPCPAARTKLEAIFLVALPTDRESRRFHLLWTSYAMLAMTDPEISEKPFVDSPNRLQERIASILEEGKSTCEFDGALDGELQAAIIVALIHGLGTAVLVGQQTADGASSSFEHFLDSLMACTGRKINLPDQGRQV